MAGMYLLQLFHRRIAACYTLQTTIVIALGLHHPVVLTDSRTFWDLFLVIPAVGIITTPGASYMLTYIPGMLLVLMRVFSHEHV
jgi:hypothetical protein